MSGTAGMALIASLLGEPARANMMAALMDGRALTAKELAYAAHVSAPTASGHLAQLAEAGLVSVERQGRHRYHRIATPLIGQMVTPLTWAPPVIGVKRLSWTMASPRPLPIRKSLICGPAPAAGFCQ